MSELGQETFFTESITPYKNDIHIMFCDVIQLLLQVNKLSQHNLENDTLE